MSAFVIEEPCRCCGGEAKGAANKMQVGGAIVCSRNCAFIHAAHFRAALAEAHGEVYRKFYG